MDDTERHDGAGRGERHGYRVFFEAADEGMAVVDPDGVVLDANPAARRLLQAASATEDGGGRRGIFDPSDDRWGRARERLRREGGFEGELRLLRGDGTAFTARLSLAPHRGERVAVVFRGVGGRGGRADVPHENAGWFRSLVRNMSENVSIVEADGTNRYVSPAIERLLGYKPEERTGKSSFELVHPDDAARARRLLDEHSRDHGFTASFGVGMRHKDGSWRRMEVTAANLLADPAVGGIVVNLRDVTERERAAEALRESEERFRTTFDRAAVGLAHVAPDGRFLRVNNRLCEIVGFGREELLAKSSGDITHSDDLGRDLELMRRLLEGEIEEYSTETRYVRKDYSQVWAGLTVALARKPSGEPSYFISVVEDITPRKKAEALLRALTPRETEVLKLLSRGKTNGEIARALSFSVATVKNRVQGITTKLGVPDRTAAAARAVELGLVAPAAEDESR